MSWYITLALVCLGSSLSYAAINENDDGSALRQVHKIWHDKCNLIVGISNEEIDQLRHGKAVVNEKIQRYILCLFVVSDVLTPDLTFNEELVDYYLPEKKGDHGKQNYFDCIEEVQKLGICVPYLLTWELVQCVYKKDPQHFLIF